MALVDSHWQSTSFSSNQKKICDCSITVSRRPVIAVVVQWPWILDVCRDRQHCRWLYRWVSLIREMRLMDPFGQVLAEAHATNRDHFGLAQASRDAFSEWTDSEDSDDDATDLDLSTGNKDACVLEVWPANRFIRTHWSPVKVPMCWSADLPIGNTCVLEIPLESCAVNIPVMSVASAVFQPRGCGVHLLRNCIRSFFRNSFQDDSGNITAPFHSIQVFFSKNKLNH